MKKRRRGGRGLWILLAAAVISVAGGSAEAKVLCASRLGSLRLRERCQRYEQQVDVRALVAASPDPVPLRDWEVPAAAPSGAEAAGLESTAAVGAELQTLTPCRLVDTRPGFSSALVGDDIGPFADHEMRTYTLEGFCGIPAGAEALSINLAVVPGPDAGFVSVGPAGEVPSFPPGPNFSSINWAAAGPALSNSLVVPLDDMGRIDVYAARAADVIIDTNGYFPPAGAGTNTIRVSGNGTPTDNGTELLAAADEINASAVGPVWRLVLGPGTFDLGTSGLQIQRRVAVVGAGVTSSIVTCDCASSAVVLLTLDEVEVRDLSIENTSTDTSTADGLSLNGSNDSVVRNVRVTTAGHDGIVVSGIDLLVDGVEVDAQGFGFLLGGIGSNATVRDSRISSATEDSIFVGAPGSSLVLEESTAQTLSATQSCLVIFGASDVTVRHSRLIANGSSYVAAGSTTATLDMTHTFVDAATSAFTGTATCHATTSPGAFVATGCP